MLSFTWRQKQSWPLKLNTSFKKSGSEQIPLSNYFSKSYTIVIAL